MISQMAPPYEVDLLMSELSQWCQQERGRQRELAAAIDVTEQVVSNWLYRRKTPSLKHWLALQAFAKKQRRSKPRGPR
jgi:DNA-binding transcriptional regulator YiaG